MCSLAEKNGVSKLYGSYSNWFIILPELFHDWILIETSSYLKVNSFPGLNWLALDHLLYIISPETSERLEFDVFFHMLEEIREIDQNI